MANKRVHIIAATVAILFTGGIWVADMIYDATNSVAIEQCGEGNVKEVINSGLFNTEVTCQREPSL